MELSVRTAREWKVVLIKCDVLRVGSATASECGKEGVSLQTCPLDAGGAPGTTWSLEM